MRPASVRHAGKTVSAHVSLDWLMHIGLVLRPACSVRGGLFRREHWVDVVHAYVIAPNSDRAPASACTALARSIKRSRTYAFFSSFLLFVLKKTQPVPPTTTRARLGRPPASNAPPAGGPTVPPAATRSQPASVRIACLLLERAVTRKRL